MKVEYEPTYGKFSIIPETEKEKEQINRVLKQFDNTWTNARYFLMPTGNNLRSEKLEFKVVARDLEISRGANNHVYSVKEKR